MRLMGHNQSSWQCLVRLLGAKEKILVMTDKGNGMAFWEDKITLKRNLTFSLIAIIMVDK